MHQQQPPHTDLIYCHETCATFQMGRRISHFCMNKCLMHCLSLLYSDRMLYIIVNVMLLLLFDWFVCCASADLNVYCVECVKLYVMFGGYQICCVSTCRTYILTHSGIHMTRIRRADGIMCGNLRKYNFALCPDLLLLTPCVFVVPHMIGRCGDGLYT